MSTAENIKIVSEALSSIGAKVPAKVVRNVLKLKAVNSGGEVLEIDPEIVDVLEIAIHTKAHTNLVGPPGCGKSTIKDVLLGQIDKNFHKIQCHKGLDVEELFGGPVPEGNSFVSKLGTVALCARDGIPLGMEEVDSLDSNRVFPLFPLLGPDKWIDVQLGAETVRVNKHPDFFVIATSNTNGTGDYDGQFGGTEIMNAALADRFSYTINVDYLMPEQELRVLELKTGIEESIGQEMIQVAVKTRLKAAAMESIMPLSTRRLMAWASAVVAAKELKKPLSITKAAEIAVINRASVEHEAALREVIDGTFRGR
jgi:MoxR-like ATPase